MRLFIKLQRKTGVLLFPIMSTRLYKRIHVRVYPAYAYVYRYTPDNQPNWWNRALYLTGYPPSASVRMLFFVVKKKSGATYPFFRETIILIGLPRRSLRLFDRELKLKNLPRMRVEYLHSAAGNTELSIITIICNI